MTALLMIGGLAATCAAGGVALLRSRAFAWGLIDVPNERSLHTRVTPRGGGIAIVITVLLGLVAMAFVQGIRTAHGAAYVGGASMVAAIGWRDDLRSLPPLLRFLTHIAAALVVIAAWGPFETILVPGWGTVTLPRAVGIGATLLWIVGLINAYNFMDGIDGIASGQAVMGGVIWVLLSGTDAPLVTATAMLIAAASLGFLWHNWPPAKIFMGDAGSGFLGFSFAVLPSMAYDATGDPRLPMAGLLVVAPFVFDTAYTFVRRLLRRENVVAPHRTHLYQRLVISGWPHAAVTALYLALAALSGAAAVGWMQGGGGWVLAVPLAGVLILPALVARAVRAGS